MRGSVDGTDVIPDRLCQIVNTTILIGTHLQGTVMKSRLIRAWNRAKYAAIFAAVGAGVGGLFGRRTASSGAALGALVGATIGEKRTAMKSLPEKVKRGVGRETSAGE